jgi:NodT family efflux transporter outer membrane factor (OMF) lipoprotein
MRRAPLLLATLVLSGCTVGPNYKRPTVAGIDAPWIAHANTDKIDQSWWKALGDPVLNDLIARAATDNFDVRIAKARLQEARANRDAAAGRALPSVSATGSATENQLSRNGLLPINNLPGFNRNYSLFDAGFDASWEIDLWGGTRRTIEAAGARTSAAEGRVADARLQTIAEVARTYVELRSGQARRASLDAEARIRGEIAGLVQRRFSAGDTSRSDVATATQRAETLEASIAGAAADIQSAIYRLGLLTGQPPEALRNVLSAPAPLPTPPAIIAAGIRSDLLKRRADIRAADADLAAATADIGVETANLYPRFSLMGGIGQQARSGSDLISESSTHFSIGPSFSWPIFSAGRIRAQIRGANARANAAAAAYEKSVLSALTDTETAINRYAAAVAASGYRDRALANAQLATRLAAQRFRAGEDDRIQWFEAQSSERVLEQASLAARLDATTSYIAVAKSLGGGLPSGKAVVEPGP